MTKVSRRSLKIKPQPMFEIMDSAKTNTKTIHLEIGDTSYFDNKNFNFLLKKNITSSNMSYAPSAGDLKLRKLMSKIYSKITDYKFTADNVVVSPCNGLITQFLESVTDIGDEVLIPDPSFSTYTLAANSLDLKTNLYRLHQKNDWQPSIDEVEKMILKNKKIKVIIICSPSNPLGSIIRFDELKRIIQLTAKHNIMCLIDDTYRQIKLSKFKEYRKYNNNIFYIYSMSKDAGIPSARLGFGIGNKEIIKKLIHKNSLVNSCQPLFIQRAAFEYLSKYQSVYLKNLKKSILARIKLVEEIFSDNNLIDYVKPYGGIFLFIKIKNTKISSIKLAQNILEKKNVCVCPGKVFGPSGEGYLRLNLAIGSDDLRKGCIKINEYINKK